MDRSQHPLAKICNHEESILVCWYFMLLGQHYCVSKFKDIIILVVIQNQYIFTRFLRSKHHNGTTNAAATETQNPALYFIL